jgi:hypothetical protein
LKQAKDILRGLGVVETLLSQGKPLGDALDDAANAVGPDGRMVLSDLVVRLRTAPADEAALAVREWTTAWDNPAVDIVATSLLASIEGRIEIGPLVASLRKTLGTVAEVLSRKETGWGTEILQRDKGYICNTEMILNVLIKASAENSSLEAVRTDSEEIGDSNTIREYLNEALPWLVYTQLSTNWVLDVARLGMCGFDR